MNAIDALLDTSGRVASVYLRSPGAVADSEQRLRTRWKNARKGLAADGASEQLLDVLDHDLDDLGGADGAALVVLRDEHDHRFVASLDDELTDDLVALDTLPRLAPLLESQQRSLAHLLVLTDRIGADIIAVCDGGAEFDHVEGEELHVHRGHPGGWSQRRFQQRAENRWDENARAVADEVRAVAERVRPRVIAVAGDERASHLLIEHLAGGWSERVVLLDEGDDDGIASATVRAVADVVARTTVELLRRYEQAAANGAATSDTVEVLTALGEGRVEVLLVHDDVDVDTRAWFDVNGTTVTLGRTDGFASGRLADVAIRAALHTDADVRIVPAASVGPDGLAAILRW